MNNHLLELLSHAWIFFIARHTCILTIPEGTRVKLDPTKDPLGCSNLSKIRLFSPDILEVLLKLTGFLGFGEGRKETTETLIFLPWISCLFWHVGVVAFLAMTVQIQPWVSTGHSTAMSRLLGQGVLLFFLQVIHTQLLDSGVIAPSVFALSLIS